MTGINNHPNFNSNVGKVGSHKNKKGAPAQEAPAKAQTNAPTFKGSSADILNSLNNAAKAGETMAAQSRISNSLQGFEKTVGKHLQGLSNDGINLNNIDVALAVSDHLTNRYLGVPAQV